MDNPAVALSVTPDLKASNRRCQIQRIQTTTTTVKPGLNGGIFWLNMLQA